LAAWREVFHHLSPNNGAIPMIITQRLKPEEGVVRIESAAV
jgi:hypothetical protein